MQCVCYIGNRFCGEFFGSSVTPGFALSFAKKRLEKMGLDIQSINMNVEVIACTNTFRKSERPIGIFADIDLCTELPDLKNEYYKFKVRPVNYSIGEVAFKDDFSLKIFIPLTPEGAIDYHKVEQLYPRMVGLRVIIA